MSDRSFKELLGLGLLAGIATALVLFTLAMTGSSTSGPTADFDIDHGGDYDNSLCHLSGSFDPGNADRIIVDTTGSTESIDITTSAGLSVVPGESVVVYAVSFSDTNTPGEVEMLTKGHVTNYCEFEVTTDE